MTDPGLHLERTFALADLPAVRAILRDYAVAAGMADERSEEFVLAAAELLANAIEHGGGRGQLRLSRANDQLCCRVRDHGPGLIAGRGDGSGLRIVRALAERLDINGSGPGGGTDVTMTMSISVVSPPFTGT